MEEQLNICVACLSRDRHLTPLHNLSQLLQEIRFEELEVSHGEVCWECWSILKKFCMFKKRAKLAQEIISKRTEYSNIKSLSTFSISIVTFCNYNDTYNCETNVKIDHCTIKEENLDSDEDIDPIDEHIDKNDEHMDKNDEHMDKNDEHMDKYDEHMDKYDEHMDKYDEHMDKYDEHSDQIEDTLEINANPIAKTDEKDNIYTEVDLIDNKHNINNLVKQENSFQDKNISFDDVNHEPIEQTENLETTDTKLTKKILRKTVKRKKKDIRKISQVIKDTDDKEFREKFVQNILTEEEMEQGREERKNHPSFRTLPFICRGCLLGFRKEVNYRNHIKKKHDEHIGNFICDICTTRFPHNLALNKHKRKHYVVYRCKLCKYEGNNLRSAVNHCRKKHADDKLDSIHCMQCKFVAKNSEDLEKHMQSEHGFWCNECGEKFTIKRNIMTHLARTHNSIRAFKCDICKKAFKTNMKLESHMSRHNDSLAKKLSYCKECDMQFKTIVIYRAHLRNNANHSEGYSCPECNKTFKGKGYLKQHHDYHHLHRYQYKCKECNKTFMSKRELNIHESKHLGKDRPRKYSCDICSKKFFNSQMLRNHKFIHTDERQFMCEDCGDTFKQKATLYTHTRLKHKGWKRPKRES